MSDLTISKSGAYVRGAIAVGKAVGLPLIGTLASTGHLTRPDVVPALITGALTYAAYINQSNATSPQGKRVKVWIVGGLLVIGAMLGALEKQIVANAPITSASVGIALLAGVNALGAYMSKAVSLAAQDAPVDAGEGVEDTAVSMSLTLPKPTAKERFQAFLRDVVRDAFSQEAMTAVPAPEAKEAKHDA